MLRKLTLIFSLASCISACGSHPSTSELHAIENWSQKFYVNPYSQASRDASAMRSSNDPNYRYIEHIARQGSAVWYVGSNNVYDEVSRQMQGAREQDAVAVVVAYNIPHRDCGQHSAGGATADNYRRWIRDMASAIGDTKTMVILEPDAVTLVDCLNSELYSERMALLNYAVQTLKAHGNTKVYIDAGHPRWLSPEEAAKRLQQAGIYQADGFALNTSNYHTTWLNAEYGRKISGMLGNKHFVIDTSRNGIDPQGSSEWCNPRGRALGQAPTMATNDGLIDAYLWAKVPGESDGGCNGGPGAGQWWREGAIELARNAGI